MSQQLRLLCIAAVLAILSGCATYGQGVQQGLDLTKKGEYQKAATTIEKALDPQGDDRLLYYTELGVVHHLAGDYEKSNKLLETAERIAEDLYTKRVSDMLASAMSNPRNSPYRGNDYERVFINYYKALNYFMISTQAKTKAEKEKALEGSRVETRRMESLLAAMENEKGSYEDQADKEKSMFNKLMKIFAMLSGEIIDKDKLVYRNDAFGNYLAGIIYEQHREWDDARISYQKSAKLYEQGYREQYKLDEGITEQAWFDTIRMMQKAGGWENEWPRLSQSKLSKTKRQELKDFNRNGHLVVIEHVGMVPQREEMNLLLTPDVNRQEFLIQPFFTGDRQQQLDQRFWFFTLYADKSVLGLLGAASDGQLGRALMEFGNVKRQGLGPLWGVADGLGLMKALEGGMRVTVPYYRVPSMMKAGNSKLTVGNEKYSMLTSQSLAHLAVQQQLLTASDDLQEAMAREALKNLTAYKVGSAGGGLLAFAGKIAANASSAAETRNWLLLPWEIKVSRIPLKEGQHKVKLRSEVLPGKVDTEETTVDIKKGEMKVWKVRTFSGAPKSTTNNVAGL